LYGPSDRPHESSGVFGLVLDGRLLSYHDLLEKDLLPLLTPRPDAV
jgi:hypothetical protein